MAAINPSSEKFSVVVVRDGYLQGEEMEVVEKTRQEIIDWLGRLEEEKKKLLEWLRPELYDRSLEDFIREGEKQLEEWQEEAEDEYCDLSWTYAQDLRWQINYLEGQLKSAYDILRIEYQITELETVIEA